MDFSNLQIILVEDNPDDALLTIRALKSGETALDIIHLKDGEEALNFIFKGMEYAGKKFDQKPKIILLDLKMPKVTGIEVLERVKSDPHTRSIPVVILTASAEDPDIEKCYELGANSYIVKPVDFDSFSATVAELGKYWLLLNKNHEIK